MPRVDNEATDKPRISQRGLQPQPNVDRKMLDRKMGSNSAPFALNLPVSNLPVELFATVVGDRMTTSFDAGLQRCLSEIKSSRADEKPIVSSTDFTDEEDEAGDGVRLRLTCLIREICAIRGFASDSWVAVVR